METNQHRLLLVEDDTSLGYLLSEYLKMKGMDLVWVQRAAEVLPLLEAQVFDLLILDVMMPVMDGGDVLADGRLCFNDLNVWFNGFDNGLHAPGGRSRITGINPVEIFMKNDLHFTFSYLKIRKKAFLICILSYCINPM